jgi:hypothetical protein
MSASIEAVNDKRILMVVSNPALSERASPPIRFWRAELTYTYREFTEHGLPRRCRELRRLKGAGQHVERPTRRVELFSGGSGQQSLGNRAQHNLADAVPVHRAGCGACLESGLPFGDWLSQSPGGALARCHDSPPNTSEGRCTRGTATPGTHRRWGRAGRCRELCTVPHRRTGPAIGSRPTRLAARATQYGLCWQPGRRRPRPG